MRHKIVYRFARNWEDEQAPITTDSIVISDSFCSSLHAIRARLETTPVLAKIPGLGLTTKIHKKHLVRR